MMFKGRIYHINGDPVADIDVTVDMMRDRFVEVDCLDCDGSGIFEPMPEIGPEKCVPCKGTGTRLVNLW